MNADDLLYDNLSRSDLDAIAARAESPTAVVHADVVALLAEVRRLRLALALARSHNADLLEAVRSALAQQDGLDLDAPIPYQLTLRGTVLLRPRGGGPR
jgi:hypothetical protein